MEKVSVSISCSPSELFSIHQDFSRRREWESGLRDIRLIGPEQHPRVGLRTCIQLWAGMSVEAEYAAFEPPRLIAVDVVKGPPFLKSFSVIWFFERGPVGSVVHVEFDLVTRPTFLRAISIPVVRWHLRHRLNRLKTYVENRPRQLSRSERI